MTDENMPQDSVENPDIRYEKKDFNLRAIIIGGVVIFVLIMAALMIAFALLGVFETRQAAVAPTSLPVSQFRATPPPPRLQPNPIDQRSAVDDMANMRATEEAILNSYGWVDREAGVVRIPIERAMNLLLSRTSPADEPAK